MLALRVIKGLFLGVVLGGMCAAASEVPKQQCYDALSARVEKLSGKEGGDFGDIPVTPALISRKEVASTLRVYLGLVVCDFDTDEDDECGKLYTHGVDILTERFPLDGADKSPAWRYDVVAWLVFEAIVPALAGVDSPDDIEVTAAHLEAAAKAVELPKAASSGAGGTKK